MLARDPSTSSPLHPLDVFYSLLNRGLPPWNVVERREVPEPYRRLLVHVNDMTPTLEKFHGCDIHLHVLGRRRLEDEYFREVVLELDRNDEPVEFGAIKIHLNMFSAEAQKAILLERRPLGHILADCHVLHSDKPSAYIRVASDELINGALKLSGAHVLYGRRNTILSEGGEPLAEIVEILPPVKAGRF
jgi:chorismate-pyruvate lyase